MKIHQHINAIYQIAYSLPEILIAILILGTITITWMFNKKPPNKVLSKITCTGLFVVFTITLIYSASNIQVYTRLFAYSYFEHQLKMLLIGASSIFAIFFSTKYIYKSISDITYSLWLGLIFSLMLTISANSLITIYIGLELYTITICFLISSISSAESKTSLNFIILSTIMSCIFLYGASLYYVNIGSVSFYSIDGTLLNTTGTIGLLFILSYLLFKLNAAPFHIWSIGTYAAAPSHIILFLDSITKLILFSIFCSFCANLFLNDILFFQKFLMVIAVISMFVGGIAPFSQNSIKKFIAYSSVGHMGFALIPLATFNNVAELKDSLTYLFSYTLGSVCFFSGLISLKKYINVNSFSDLKGAIKIYPTYAYSMVCGLFSMAGLPPFVGFITKIDIFNAMIKYNKLYICAIMLIYTILTISYTIKALKHIFRKGTIEEKKQTNFAANTFNATMIVFLVFSSIWFKYIDKQSVQIINSLAYYHKYTKSFHTTQTTEMDLDNNKIKLLRKELKLKNDKTPSITEKILEKLLFIE